MTRAAETIWKAHGKDMSRVLVLLPNQRSCTYFLKSLQELAVTPVLAPEVVTLEKKILECAPGVVADRLETELQLYKAYQNTGGHLSLDEFMGIGSVMLDDFEELDLQMADARLFFKNLELLQSMKVYEPGEEPDLYQLQYRKFWEQFGLCYHELKRLLTENKRFYKGLALRTVAENSAMYLSGIVRETDSVYLIGFTGLNKTDEVVIDYLRLNSHLHMIWDADKYYVDNEKFEAGFYFRKHKSKYKISEKAWVNELTQHPMNIEVIGTAKNIGQVKVVADILQNKLQKDKADYSDTVVIIPDEKLLAPLIASMPSVVKNLNVTMGTGINGSLCATWLETVFQLQESAHKFSNGKSPRFYHRDIFDLLLHPFCSKMYEMKRVDGFLANLKKKNRVVVTAKELQSVFQEFPQELFSLFDSAQHFSSFISFQLESILSMTINVHRTGQHLWDTEAEIAQRLLQSFAGLQQVFSQGFAMELKSVIALMRQTIADTKVSLEGEPVRGLQLMGLQESRALNFKNVIVLSANEGILPSGKQSRSYIPYEIRREFLTTYRERDSVTAYLFYRLLHQAENVYLLYNTEPDELGGGEKSRFILQLQNELSVTAPHVTFSECIYAVEPTSSMASVPIIIPKTDEMLEKMMSIYNYSGLSPSALNTFVNCSLQYYFRYVAGLREQDEMEESMDSGTIGSAVHYALEQIYKPYLGKTILPDQLKKSADDRPQIESFIREHLLERFDDAGLKSGKNYLLFKVCVKLTEQFLQEEIKRISGLSKFGKQVTLILLETELKSVLIVGDKSVQLAGRADRIDSLEDTIRIADYKTTSVKKLKPIDADLLDELFVNPEYSKALQLFLYAWMYRRTNMSDQSKLSSGIYWLRDNSKGYDALRTSVQDSSLTNQLLYDFEQKLTEKVSELLSKEMPFEQTHDHDRCKYCDFANICNRS